MDSLREWYAVTVAKGRTASYDPDTILDAELWGHLTDIKKDVPELLTMI